LLEFLINLLLNLGIHLGWLDWGQRWGRREGRRRRRWNRYSELLVLVESFQKSSGLPDTKRDASIMQEIHHWHSRPN
jgi:hypothetical protein